MQIDLGLQYTSGITKPVPTQIGYIAVVDSTGLNLTYIPSIPGGGFTLVSQTGSATAASNTVNEYGAVASAFVFTLPPSPANGDFVAVKAPTNNSAHNLTVARNGHSIDGVAADDILTLDNQARTYVYSTANGWRVLSSNGTGAGGSGGTSAILNTPVATAFPATNGSHVDITYTAPASPSGPKRVQCWECTLRVSTAPVGGGTANAVIGTTAGGNDIMTAQNIGAGALGDVFGDKISQLGSNAQISSDGSYKFYLAAGASLTARISCTAGSFSAGAVEFRVLGVAYS